jgi:DNA-binding LacI/PurR family transcriptional regulator
MAPRTSKPNIYDVAGRAGVSHQTVSRVLNNHRNVRDTTRQTVLAAMHELGFVPNQAARALVTSRTKLIGILAADTTLYGPAGGVNAMEVEARRAGYVSLTCTIDPDSDDEIRAGIEHLRQLGVEGVIVITTHNRPTIIAREMLTLIPVVGIDAEFKPGELSVEVDNVDAAIRATQHLLDLGHTRIIHISGPEASFVARQRIDGYEAAMLRAGLQPQLIHGDWDIETGYRIGLGLDTATTSAVFTANDHLALGLLKACRERSIEVPTALSVIGFDDIPEAPYFDPPLTTMRQEFRAIGHQAMELLLAKLAGEPNLESAFIPLDLVERASTGPAPKR